MSSYVIKGGKTLTGTVKISGNKNAVLTLMAATLLTGEKCLLDNAPIIEDVDVLGKIMQDLGVKIKGLGTHRLEIDAAKINKYSLNPQLTAKLRASILLLGPLLARFGQARLRHPGGCLIGRRAVGTHFEALEALGAKIITGVKDYEAEVVKLKPAQIFLDEVSVTATENALMMASLIEGTTIIDDAAAEPSVVDLANFLNLMGAKIEGAGTNHLVVQGSKKLRGASLSISPDYIDAGTFAIIAAVTKSKIAISGVNINDLTMILLYLKRFGVKYDFHQDILTIYPSELIAPKGKVQTRPWPGFPTDLMSPLIVLATQAQGTTLCHDWMFESRMFFVDKLISMGANITLCDPHRVLVTGPSKLVGKTVEGPDIRAGIALVVAALCAKGESVIKNTEIIARGHEEIEGRLSQLGADIKKIA